MLVSRAVLNSITIRGAEIKEPCIGPWIISASQTIDALLWKCACHAREPSELNLIQESLKDDKSLSAGTTLTGILDRMLPHKYADALPCNINVAA